MKNLRRWLFGWDIRVHFGERVIFLLSSNGIMLFPLFSIYWGYQPDTMAHGVGFCMFGKTSDVSRVFYRWRFYAKLEFEPVYYTSPEIQRCSAWTGRDHELSRLMIWKRFGWQSLT